MYLIEMFADPSDGARFLAILMSAACVGLGVWYTQRQTNKREGRTLRVAKIEELYKAALKCIHSLYAIQTNKLRPSNRVDELEFPQAREDILKSRGDMRMLANLYFLVEQLDYGNEVEVEDAIANLITAKSDCDVPNASIKALTAEAEYYLGESVMLSSELITEHDSIAKRKAKAL